MRVTTKGRGTIHQHISYTDILLWSMNREASSQTLLVNQSSLTPRVSTLLLLGNALMFGKLTGVV